MTDRWIALVESNTTGSGRLFCARAREMGLRPVLLSRDASRYPYVAADAIDTRQVDTTDIAAVEAACAALGPEVRGVTSSSEYSIATAAAVARRLGLPHPDPDAVRACRDKHTQRQVLHNAGMPGPLFAAAPTPDAAVAVAAGIGLPVVVKPVMGSGSIGVRRCATLDEVRAAASAVLDVDPATLALPPQPAVLVEEYVTGAEYSVETLDTEVVGVTRKHLGPEPYFLEIGHDFPAPLDAADTARVAEAALAALRALGLGWGPAHVELRSGPDGPRIIEVNPRLAGGMIPRMVEAAYGVDMVLHTVARAVGDTTPPRPTRTGAAAIRFVVAERSGRVARIDGERRARAVPGVVEVGLLRTVGDRVELRHAFTDRLGYVVAAGPSGDAAAAAADQGVRILDVHIDATAVAMEASSG